MANSSIILFLALFALVCAVVSAVPYYYAAPYYSVGYGYPAYGYVGGYGYYGGYLLRK